MLWSPQSTYKLCLSFYLIPETSKHGVYGNEPTGGGKRKERTKFESKCQPRIHGK